MQGRALMAGRKDTKTRLSILPLSVDKATISPSTSTISQGASDVLGPIANQAAHQETHVVP